MAGRIPASCIATPSRRRPIIAPTRALHHSPSLRIPEQPEATMAGRADGLRPIIALRRRRSWAVLGGTLPDGCRCSTVVVAESAEGGALGTRRHGYALWRWQGELSLHRHSPQSRRGPAAHRAGPLQLSGMGDDATAPLWRPGPASRTAAQHHRNLAQVVKIPTPKKLVAVHPGRR